MAAILASIIARPAAAQFTPPPPAELSSAVRVDEVDSSVRVLLERVKSLVADKQWDEAVETLRQVMEKSGGRLIRLGADRYIPVREYCQMRLAELPPAGLALYRSRVDPLAKRWFDQGVAQRDAELLRRVADEFFLSSWGDDASFALGEIALEQGDFQQARWCWERISPELRTPAGLPLWRPAMKNGESLAKAKGETASGAPAAAAWLAYPDTDLNLADVRARLVLASIMAGELDRARIELDDFARRHPTARGRIAGHEGTYVELLGEQLAAAARRPAAPPPVDWPTFAGSPERTLAAAPHPGNWNRQWKIELPDSGPPAEVEVVNDQFGRPPIQLHLRLPSPVPPLQSGIHPLVVGNLVLFNTLNKIYAFDLRTGRPAWPLPGDSQDRNTLGEIYAGPNPSGAPFDPAGRGAASAGAARFTMTVVGQRLYARLGDPVTSRVLEAGFSTGESYLVCLDLAAQGRLVWRTPQPPADADRWAFEGSPVADRNDVYVAMRYGDVQPQEHVACFDAQTGALRWRRFVCAADSPSRVTHNLLTLAGDTLYLNTNLGAVAAMSAADGQIRWISLYPRAKHRSASDIAARKLNPCIYCRGSLFVAPADCDGVFALDAATGQWIWKNLRASDITQLLGVGGGNLLASGTQLWWLDINSGDEVHHWPDHVDLPDHAVPRDRERGVLVGNEVYFPWTDGICRFRQSIGRSAAGASAGDSGGVEVRDANPVPGGNLIVAGGHLLIAGPSSLVVLGSGAAKPQADDHALTQSQRSPTFLAP